MHEGVQPVMFFVVFFNLCIHNGNSKSAVHGPHG